MHSWSGYEYRGHDNRHLLTYLLREGAVSRDNVRHDKHRHIVNYENILIKRSLLSTLFTKPLHTFPPIWTKWVVGCNNTINSNNYAPFYNFP